MLAVKTTAYIQSNLQVTYKQLIGKAIMHINNKA